MSEHNRTNLTYVIRIAAGAYLIYLSYQLFSQMKTNNDWKWYIILFAAIFCIGAVFLIITSVRSLIAENKASRNAGEGENESSADGGAESDSAAPDGSLPTAAPQDGTAEEEKTETEELPVPSGLGKLFGAQPVKPRDSKEIRDRLKMMNAMDGLETEPADAETPAAQEDAQETDASQDDAQKTDASQAEHAGKDPAEGEKK